MGQPEDGAWEYGQHEQHADKGKHERPDLADCLFQRRPRQGRDHEQDQTVRRCHSSTTVLYSGVAALGPGPIPEDAALRLVSDRPRSLYPMTKLTNEYMGHLFCDLHGVDHVALRFGAVLGGHAAEQTSVPGQLFDLLVGAARSGGTVTLDNPLFLWGGGEEFVDLRDCARAIRAALDADAPRQGVYNIAHPRQWTLGEIVSEVARQKGAFECVRPEEVETGFAGFPFQRPAPSDLSAAEAELGFVCRHDLTDTLDHWWRTCASECTSRSRNPAVHGLAARRGRCVAQTRIRDWSLAFGDRAFRK